MGLPVAKLICASNENNVLTDFINTGVYDKNRSFYTTISPSMDILVSSNLERLLYHVTDDDKTVAELMSALSANGRYQVEDSVKKAISDTFCAGYCTDEETKKVINSTFSDKGYLIDTHTAVAYGVLKKYRGETGDETATVVVSTASPYKFTDSVLTALGEAAEGSGPDLIDRLEERTSVLAPYPLKSLRGRVPRFTDSVCKEKLTDVVRNFLS